MVPATGWNAPEFPRLRRDLTSKPTEPGKAVFRVRAPDSDSVCLLYDVELALVRLMDGKRDLDSLVSKGKQLGLPLNRDLLAKFIRELAAYHFIENAGPLPALGDSGSFEAMDNIEVTEPGAASLLSGIAARAAQPLER